MSNAQQPELLTFNPIYISLSLFLEQNEAILFVFLGAGAQALLANRYESK